LDSDQALANQKRRLLANELFGQPIIIFSTRKDMIEHLFEEGEHPMWSQPATISLSSLFGPSGVTFISPFSTLSLMI